MACLGCRGSAARSGCGPREAPDWKLNSRSLDVETMCRLYGAPADLTEGLMGLAKETKSRGWWHSYGEVIPEHFDVYIGLEDAASHFSVYQSELVPGLLQTADYARTVIRAGNPGMDEAEIELRVQLRIARALRRRRAGHVAAGVDVGPMICFAKPYLRARSGGHRCHVRVHLPGRHGGPGDQVHSCGREHDRRRG